MSIFDGISDETQSSIGNALGAIGAGLMTGNRYQPVGPGFNQFLGNLQKGAPKEALKALLLQAGASPEDAEKFSATEKTTQLKLAQLKEQKSASTLSGLVGSMPSDDGGGAAPVSNLGMGAPSMTPPAPGGPAAGVSMNGSTAEKAKAWYDEAIKQGASPLEASAMVGNFTAENGLNTSGKPGDSGTAFGGGQWRNERFDNLKKLAQQRGESWDSIPAQVAHTLSELNGGDAGAARARALIAKAKTPEEAAGIFAQHFERPANDALAATLPTRQNAAAQAFRAFGQDGAPTQTADASGSVPLPGGPIMPAGASGMNPKRPVQVADDENATQVLEGKMGMYPRSVYGITPDTQTAAADKPEAGAQEAGFEIPPGGGRPAMPGVVPSAQTQGTPAEQSQAAGVAKQAATVLQAPAPSSNAGPTTQVAYAKRVKAWAEKAIVAAPLLGDQGKGLSDLAKSRLDEANKTISGQFGQPFTDADGNKWQVGPDNQWHSMTDARPGDVKDYEYGQRDPNFRAYQKEMKEAGRSQVNIDQRAEGKFEEGLGTSSAKRFNDYIEQGDAAKRRLGDVGVLRETSRTLGSLGKGADFRAAIGPYAESLGIKIDGLSDIQLFQSTAARLAPQLREPGAGATSDKDLAGFEKAIGQLSATPEARGKILDVFEAASRNQLEAARIARDVAGKRITRQEGEDKLQSLPDPMTAFREYRKANPEPGAPETAQKPAQPLSMTDRATSLRNARSALAANPGARDAIMRRLKDAGLPTEGL